MNWFLLGKNFKIEHKITHKFFVYQLKTNRKYGLNIYLKRLRIKCEENSPKL